jgi:UDP-2,3-diacylglucosamine pyrophosphatase LpxH
MTTNPPAAATTDRAHNIVVLSDVHLGEDLMPGAPHETRRHVDLAESTMVDFIRHLSRWRVDGRPWRLVINGDLADFMTVLVAPDKGENDDDLRAEDREHGLPRREEVAVAKMNAIAARHPRVFDALARFLASGNRVELISGNHDRELALPGVETALRAALRAAAPAGRADEIDARLGVHAWFYYEPGVAWIEHGHQYDETCSFEFGLAPSDPVSGELVTNVDFAAVRYLGGSAPDIDRHGTDEWSFAGYLHYASTLGLRGFYRVGKGYARFAGSLLRAARMHGSHGRQRTRQEQHETGLGALAEHRGIDRDVLRRVDELRRPPVTTSLRRLSRVLMLDRLLLTMGAAVVAVGALAALSWPWAIPVAAIVATGAHVSGQAMSRGRRVDPSIFLSLVPARIRRHVDAPFIVFGHSHEAVSQSLPGGGTYFNSGTWLPAIKPGILRAFTHVVILHGTSGPTASLRQWRDGASRAYTPDPKVKAATAQLGSAAAPATPVPTPSPVV